jgi:hypothetical protein
MGLEDRNEELRRKAWLSRAMKDFRQRLGIKEPKPSALDQCLEVHFLDADGHEVDPTVIQARVAKVRDALSSLNGESDRRPASSRCIKSHSGAARVRAYLAEHPEMTQADFAFKAQRMDEKTLRRITDEKKEEASRSTWVRVAAAMSISVEELLS